MKYSLPNEYYRMLGENCSYHVLVFWDPVKGCWLDEDGFEIENIYEYIPLWGLRLAEIERENYRNYFCFQPNSWTLIEMFWPDDEEFAGGYPLGELDIDRKEHWIL